MNRLSENSPFLPELEEAFSPERSLDGAPSAPSSCATSPNITLPQERSPKTSASAKKPPSSCDASEFDTNFFYNPQPKE